MARIVTAVGCAAALGLLPFVGCGGGRAKTDGAAATAGTTGISGASGHAAGAAAAGGAAGAVDPIGVGGAGGTGSAPGGTTGQAGGGTAAVGGSGGVSGASGAGGAGGVSGASGAGGSGGAAGTGGTGGATGCAFTVASSLSPAIPTVGIVTFTTSLAGVSAAEIRFGLAATGPTMTAPVDLTQPGYRTLLLGMKASSGYVFRIVATSAAGTCTSEDYTLTTGALPSGPPTVTATIANAAAHARGFIITTNTLAPWVGAYIFDSDGSVVWAAPFPTLTSRAHMSWDGRDMYMVSENPNGPNAGSVGRISMDGMTVDNNLSGVDKVAHHDLTAIPGGIAVLTWSGAGGSVVERAADGTLTTVVELANVYNNAVHSNAIHYAPWDDTYTISDRNANLFVKITRKGQLLWQFGGANPKDATRFFTGLQAWTGNHGHHLLADGTFLFFNNGNGTDTSAAVVFKLDTAKMTAERVLAYKSAAAGVSSFTLGDVQRLPNGSMLVTYSAVGQMEEVDPSGKVVASFRGRTYGYAEYRESLYGPPSY